MDSQLRGTLNLTEPQPPMSLCLYPLQNGAVTELRSVLKTQCKMEVCVQQSRAKHDVFICIHSYTNKQVVYDNQKAVGGQDSRSQKIQEGRDSPAVSQDAFSQSHGGRREARRGLCLLSR